MDECIFCKIAKGEIQTSKVYEDDRVVAFLDLHPKAHGHTLVIPKAHSPNFMETPDDVLAMMMPKLKIIADKQMKATKTSGFNLQVNNGESSGQEIHHLHFHIIPR